MGKNDVLKGFAEPLMAPLRDALEAGEEIIPRFGECRYAAGSWKKQERRVIIKADIALHPGRKPKDNPRFIVTKKKPRRRSSIRRCTVRAVISKTASRN